MENSQKRNTNQFQESEKLIEERKSLAECGNYITKEVLVSIIRTFLKEFTINHVSLFGFPLKCDSNHKNKEYTRNSCLHL